MSLCNLTTEQAYANGRKDEREAVLKYLREEAQHWREMARDENGEPFYDNYVVVIGILLADIEAWQ